MTDEDWQQVDMLPMAVILQSHPRDKQAHQPQIDHESPVGFRFRAVGGTAGREFDRPRGTSQISEYFNAGEAVSYACATSQPQG